MMSLGYYLRVSSSGRQQAAFHDLFRFLDRVTRTVQVAISKESQIEKCRKFQVPMCHARLMSCEVSCRPASIVIGKVIVADEKMEQKMRRCPDFALMVVKTRTCKLQVAKGQATSKTCPLSAAAAN